MKFSFKLACGFRGEDVDGRTTDAGRATGNGHYAAFNRDLLCLQLSLQIK